MIGIGIDQIVLPNLDIGRINAPDEHAGTGKILVPLDALAVLDDEVLTLVGGVHAVTRVALFKGRHCDGPHTINQGGLGKSEGIAFKQAVACRVATVVAPETAGHDRPGHGMLTIDTTTAFAIGIVEVGKTQHMAELMADGADAGNIVVVDIVLILFSCHIG